MTNRRKDHGREARQDTRPARPVALQGDEDQAEDRADDDRADETASRQPEAEGGDDKAGGRPDKDADAQADESDIKKKAPTDLPGAMGGGLMGG